MAPRSYSKTYKVPRRRKLFAVLEASAYGLTILYSF